MSFRIHSYDLTIHRMRECDCLPHSGSNCLLEDLYNFKATQNQIEELQIQEVQQGVQNGDLSNFLKLRKSALGTFYACIVFLICYLPSYILSFLFMARLLSSISYYNAWPHTTTLFFLNSSLNPVIYCWKMGPIRRTLMDIMRGIVNRFRQ